MHRLVLVLALASAGAFAAPPASAANLPDLETVAVSGQQAPGGDPGVNFRGFDRPVLNAAGQTAFSAFLTGSGVDGGTNNAGIYSEGGGTLAEVVREGRQVPGANPGVIFGGFDDPLFNAAGQTVFRNDRLTGTGVGSSNNEGIYRESGGTLAEVVREGQQVPDADAGVVFSGSSRGLFGFETFADPMLNSAGHIAFRASVAGTGVDSTTDNNIGIYRENDGTLAQVARAGQQAPGASGDVKFEGFSDPVLNSAGRTAFVGGLTGSGVTGSNDTGIYSEGGGTLAEVARKGQQAPGAASAVNFNFFNTPVLNGAGQIAFTAFLRGSSVNSSNDSGIYREAGEALVEVVREGKSVPDPGTGLKFGDLGSPVLNAAGHIAFRADLTGPTVDEPDFGGIYRESGETLVEVARTGRQAPGADPGVNFGGFGEPVLNAAGQIAFTAFLAGSGVDGSNDEGIYATDRGGDLLEIVRTGDLFDVNDDPLIEDLRTISFVNLVSGSGGEDGRRTSFNDLGQLAFQLGFTDGTEGVFVSNIVAIPEPTTAGLLGLGGIVFLSRRNRRTPDADEPASHHV